MTRDEFLPIYDRMEAIYGPVLEKHAAAHLEEFFRCFKEWTLIELNQVVDRIIETWKPWGRRTWPLPSELKDLRAELSQTGKLKSRESEEEKRERQAFNQARARVQRLEPDERQVLEDRARAVLEQDITSRLTDSNPKLKRALIKARLLPEMVAILEREGL